MTYPFKFVSADDHINEPPDLWQSRIEARFREQAPKVVKYAGGDAWTFEGQTPRPLGLGAVAGKKFEEYKTAGVSYEEMRSGAYDPHARLKDMDLDNSHAQVIYPGVALYTERIQDRELRLACIRAYNGWISEFCSTNPNRLLGVAVMPPSDPQAAAVELHRVAKFKGIGGCMVQAFPELRYSDPAYDSFWAAAQEVGLPVSFHIGALRGFKMEPRAGVGEAHMTISTMALVEIPALMIWCSVLQRYPGLKMVLVESGIGWLGYFVERLDNVYRRQRHWAKSIITAPPSEYFHRQVFATFEEDFIGVQIRHSIGVDNILWASDYPHNDTTWPESVKTIEEHFRGVPEEEKRKIVCDNTARVYGISLS